MQFGVLLIVALVPFIITPGLTFSFDILPKNGLLFLSLTGLLWFCKNYVKTPPVLLRRRGGKWLLACAALLIFFGFLATLFSTSPGISLAGSAWRRYGFLTQAGLAIFGLLCAEWLCTDEANLNRLLRTCSVIGLVESLYVIAQYSGVDPLLPAAAYHAGEAEFTIVRPPGTLGHADYLAAWMVASVFLAVMLAIREDSRTFRWLGMFSAGLGFTAIVLSGTRAAMLGLLCGALVLLYRAFARERARIGRRVILGLLIYTVCAAGFYASPWGAPLRARIHWSMDDAWGGARPWLWRDSIQLALAHPFFGIGPETFEREFPRFQSLELARRYPDFHHESPHNVFLDALTSQGIGGLLALSCLAWLGFAVAGRARGWQGTVALAAWSAYWITNQFVVFTLTTGLYAFVLCSVILTLPETDPPVTEEMRRSPPLQRRLAIPVLAAIAVLVVAGAVVTLRLLVADHSLLSTRTILDQGGVPAAVASYQGSRAFWWPGPAPDLAYSRWMVEASAQSRNPGPKAAAWREAVTTAASAANFSENRQDAWYNLAILLASQDDAHGTEQSLRNAMESAPQWFKPHWMLAQLLQLQGLRADALAEAERAVQTDGSQHPEVQETRDRIRRLVPGN
jgi:O-antigen ligase